MLKFDPRNALPHFEKAFRYQPDNPLYAGGYAEGGAHHQRDRTATRGRQGNVIRFHPTLFEFAGRYRFDPRPVAVARGNEKGRVERAIRYIRTAFFAAREFADLDDLNAQADVWCRGLAADRPCPEQNSFSVPQY